VNVALPLVEVQTMMLAAVRIVAFLFLAPPFSHGSVPAGVKVALSFGLALAVSPRLPGAIGDRGLVTGVFVGELALQAVIGAALGFMVYLVFAALQSAGNLIDLFGGFQIAQAFDPMSQTSSAQFGRLYQFLAVVLLFASDGYQIVLTGLVRTFDVLPLGKSLDLGTYSSLATTGLTQMFVAAVQIAGPLIVVLFLADVGLGLLTRVAPALNAFAMGFPLKILLTLSFASLAMLALPQVIATLTGTAVESLLGGAR
jgi:flagellar biosynthetic protein FliR